MNNQDPYTSRELGSWMGLDSQDPYYLHNILLVDLNRLFIFKRWLIPYDYLFVTLI